MAVVWEGREGRGDVSDGDDDVIGDAFNLLHHLFLEIGVLGIRQIGRKGRVLGLPDDTKVPLVVRHHRVAVPPQPQTAKPLIAS